MDHKSTDALLTYLNNCADLALKDLKLKKYDSSLEHLLAAVKALEDDKPTSASSAPDGAASTGS